MKNLVAFVLALIIFVSPACNRAKQDATLVKNDIIACAKQDLGQTVKDAGISVLMAVVAIIATGGTDWQSDLLALGKKYGPDALACASKIASDLFKPLATSTPSTGDAIDTPYSRAQEALAQFASGRKFE